MHADFRNDLFKFQWFEITVKWRLTYYITLNEIPLPFYELLIPVFRICGKVDRYQNYSDMSTDFTTLER